MLKKVNEKSRFGYNVLTLMTGSSLAQAITLALSPILTRLYSPEDFGQLATYIAIVSVVSVVASLRYELAITQPEHDEDAMAIVFLSIFITVSISSFLFLALYFFGSGLLSSLGAKSISAVVYLIPVSVLIVGFYQTLNYWNIRKGRYKQVALGKFSHNIGMGGGQVLFSGMSGYGLIFGCIVGQFLYLLVFLKSFWVKDKHNVKMLNGACIKNSARSLGTFPVYSSAGALANTTSLQMPIFVLNNFYPGSVVGMFSLTFRVLGSPAVLISTSVSQVLLQRVSKAQFSPSENLMSLVIKLLLLLIVAFIPFGVLIYLFGGNIFAFAFGSEWRAAGDYATIVIFAIWVRFSVSPLSSVMMIKKNVKKGVCWQFLYFLTLTTTLLFFSDEKIEILLLAFTVHEIVLYLLYLLIILTSIRKID